MCIEVHYDSIVSLIATKDSTQQWRPPYAHNFSFVLVGINMSNLQRRTAAKGKLQAMLQRVEWVERLGVREIYASHIEEAIFSSFRDPEEYRDQLQVILANGSAFLSENENYDPKLLGRCTAQDLLTKKQQHKRDKFLDRRAQAGVNDNMLACPNCNLIRRERLNLNRVGLDSEEFGIHFETQFENYCTCETSVDVNVATAGDSSSDDDGAESPREEKEVAVEPPLKSRRLES